MSALADNAPEGADAAPDVLSPAEERVLGLARSAVGGIRARGLPVEPDSVAGALGAACVQGAAGPQAAGSEYLANGARFALRRGAGPPGCIEISFVPRAS